MTIIVPDENTSFEDLIQNVDSFTADLFKEHGFKRKVHLYLPKFTIKSDIDLNEPLKQVKFNELALI